ncbi:hypothetical protein [Streptomyces sp. DSM 40907]|uniref:hypothetical protein n=1 Tax=Streptomyces kutzneri TaxID=3051179 RepID=UPI0028D89624|nr:hypothetical protein [Streptomyces sp. DSM 40907]
MTGPVPHAARMPEREMYAVLRCEPCEECAPEDRQSVNGLATAEAAAAPKPGHRATPVEARYLSGPTP